MASLAIVDFLGSNSPLLSYSVNSHSQFLSSTSFLKLRKKFLIPKLKPLKPISPNSRSSSVAYAWQSNFYKVVQTVWKVGKDGIDAGTSLVPASVPRPIARISVTVAALSVSLFLLKSVLSTALFALATMGFVYFVFIALNKDQGPKNGGGDGTNSEDPLEEARRIMEKYK